MTNLLSISWAMSLAGALASASTAEPEPAGAIAPANRWYTEGGCAARSGLSHTAPFRRQPEVAWTWEPPGGIEGEPLVWDDRVVVAVDRGDQREVSVRRLLDGSELASARLPQADRPLDPSLWDDRLLVRSAPNEISCLEIPRSGRQLVARWKYDAGAPVLATLMFEDEIYLRLPGEIRRLRYKSREPVWTVKGQFRGRLSLRGAALYAVEYHDSNARLVLLARVDGQRLAAGDLGMHAGGAPAEIAAVRIAVFGEQVQVRHALPVLGSGGAYNTTILRNAAAGELPLVTLTDTLAEPTEAAGKRLQLIRDKGPVLALFDGEERYRQLAEAQAHAEFIADAVPASCAGEVALIGGRAFLPEGGHVLWWHELAVAQRAIPARRTVLLVERGAKRLIALRPAGTPVTGAGVADSGELWLKAVLRDGSPLSGTLVLAPADGVLRKTIGSGAPTKLADVLVAVDKAGSIHYAPDGESAARGIGLLLEDAAADAQIAALLTACRGLPASTSARFRMALVRAVLERDPQQQDAAALVRAALPAGVPLAQPFVPLDWLDFIDAVERCGVALVPPTFAEGDADLSVAQRQLGAARAFWRPDLHAIESRHLMIITPLQAPGRVALCVAMGELVCETLDRLFAGGSARRDQRFPLQLHLFERQQEYLEYGAKHGVRTADLEWTAGHYSPADDVTRVFLPADRDAFARVMQVYAHELTHHWVAQRCPRFSSADKRHTATTPGYWIVEGFASLLEEFVYDLDTWTCETVNPRADSLDTLSNLTARQLLPWADLLAWSQDDFHRLSKTASLAIPSRWQLGARRQLGEIGLFYDQATGICQFLYHADDGRHRAALFELVELYYTGRYTPADLPRLTGIAASELGERVNRFARERATVGR